MSETDAATGDADSPEITITVPATSEYLSVLRTTAAGLAARLDFTLDEIEDLRITVDEACAILLEHAAPGGRLDGRFVLDDGELSVRFSAPTGASETPESTGFSWLVLTALAADVGMSLQPAPSGNQLVVTARHTPGRSDPQ